MECVLSERTKRYLFELWREYIYTQKMHAYAIAILTTRRVVKIVIDWRNITLADCFRRYCERSRGADSSSQLALRIVTAWQYQTVGIHRVGHILQWGLFRKKSVNVFQVWRSKFQSRNFLRTRVDRLRAISESRALQHALTIWISNFFIQLRVQPKPRHRSGKEELSMRPSPDLDRTLLYTPSDMSQTLPRFPTRSASPQSLLGLRRKHLN